MTDPEKKGPEHVFGRDVREYSEFVLVEGDPQSVALEIRNNGDFGATLKEVDISTLDRDQRCGDIIELLNNASVLYAVTYQPLHVEDELADLVAEANGGAARLPDVLVLGYKDKPSVAGVTCRLYEENCTTVDDLQGLGLKILEASKVDE